MPGAVGGSEIVARNLLREIPRLEPQLEMVVYCGREAVDSLRAEPFGDRCEFVVSPAPSKNKPARVAAELTWLPWRARRDRLQLLHSLGTTSPPFCPVPSVVTILDVIYHHFPETFPRAAQLGLRLVVPAGARRAEKVLAISEAGKRETAATLRIEPDRIEAIHLGFGFGAEAPEVTPAAELRARHGLGDAPLVLTVSSSLRHKNLDRLLEAFAALEGNHDARLVVVGHAGRDQEALRERAGALGIGDRVVFTGWIEDTDLEGFYAAASVFVYPTLMEGFGMPVLEAMRREAPVACSNLSALPEVAGDAAENFDPYDVESIAAALRRLLESPERRTELVALGREQCRRFTWEDTARKTLAVYREVLQQ
ncbi:MAG: glycosyltransferase family 4 protein [Solirubrobacterales bacterium]